jgi:hypothetical protein
MHMLDSVQSTDSHPHHSIANFEKPKTSALTIEIRDTLLLWLRRTNATESFQLSGFADGRGAPSFPLFGLSRGVQRPYSSLTTYEQTYDDESCCCLAPKRVVLSTHSCFCQSIVSRHGWAECWFRCGYRAQAHRSAHHSGSGYHGLFR